MEGEKEKEGGGRQFLARGSQAIVIQDELKLKGLHHRDCTASFIILSRDRVCNAGPESGPEGEIDGTKTLPHPHLDGFHFTGIEAGHKPIRDSRKLKQLSLQVCVSVRGMMDLYSYKSHKVLAQEVHVGEGGTTNCFGPPLRSGQH